MERMRILIILLMSVLLTACSKNPTEVSAATVPTPAGANAEAGGGWLLAETAKASGKEGTEEENPEDERLSGKAVMQIQVQGNGHTIVFELNDSPASRSLYRQLPLTIEVQDYSSNEKIFYPPDELEIGDTPLTEGGGAGRLAYFASWGDVILYYGDFGPYSGLYDLGTAITGSEWIPDLSGEILIEAALDERGS